MKIQSLKGMDDVLPDQVAAWQVLESLSRIFFEAHGFREIRTPVLELTALFARSIGEASDIVHKEMYAFEDRGGRHIALRPEMTASVVRSALEHNLIKEKEPLFLYYLGPMFRAERPQAGRKRQFHQIGIEALNTHSALSDAELIVLISNFLQWVGLSEYLVKINHLGSEEDRTRYSKVLTAHFSNHQHELCEDCRYRLTKNVLRIFDCKNAACQAVIRSAPEAVLSQGAAANFCEIRQLLDHAGVKYVHEKRLVRGLDYYTGLVFEVTSLGLGSQDAILAGGRYDRLIEDLGGPRTGACGFSIGTERILMALQASGADFVGAALEETVFVAAMKHDAATCSFYRRITTSLAHSKKRAVFSYGSASLGSHLKKANKSRVRFAIIVGESEFERDMIAIKDLESGKQIELKPEDLSSYFKQTSA